MFSCGCEPCHNGCNCPCHCLDKSCTKENCLGEIHKQYPNIPISEIEAKMTHLQEELKKISEDWKKTTNSEMLDFVRHLCENVPSIVILWMVTDAQLHILNSLLPKEKQKDLKAKDVSLVSNKIITPN